MNVQTGGMITFEAPGADHMETGLCKIGENMTLAATQMALAQKECCAAWHTYLDNEVDVPATSVTCPDGSTINIPGFTGSAATADYLCNQSAVAAWSAAQQAQLDEYNAQWTKWYDDYIAWRDLQQVLYFAELIASAAQLVISIKEYNKYLMKMNMILNKTCENVNTQCVLLENTEDSLLGKTLSCIGKLLSTQDSNHNMANAGATDFCNKAKCMFDIFDAHYKPIQNTHAQNVAQCAVNAIIDMRDNAAKMGDDACLMQTQWDTLFKTNFDTLIPKLFGTACCSQEALCELQEKLALCACKYLDHYENEYEAREIVLKDMFFDIAECMAVSLKEQHAKQVECADDLEAKYQMAYGPKEMTVAPAILCMTECMMEEICNVRDLLLECAEADRQCYESVYKVHEAGQAASAMETAATAIPKIQTAVDFFCNDAPIIRAIYDTCYEGGECAAAIAALDCSAASSPMVKVCVDWFKTHADKMQDFWEQCYKDPECAFVVSIIEKAERLCEQAESNINCLSEWAQEWKDIYDNCYKDAECEVAPYIIRCVKESAECIKAEMEWTKDKQKHLWGKFEDYYCPCDELDLKKVCDIWLKTNMMTNICDNSECAKQLAICTQDAYETEGKPCEIEYLREVCAMACYEPKYCDMEDRAIMYIEKEYQRKLQELDRCGDRHCANATEELKCRLEREKTEAVAAAISRANVIERHWEVSEKNRRHRYHMDMFNDVVERWPITALQGIDTSNRGNDLLLQAVHQRLARQEVMLNGVFEMGRLAISGYANLLETGTRWVQYGHDWAQRATNTKDMSIKETFNVWDDAVELIRNGHYFPQQAANDKQAAMQGSLDAVRLGAQFTDLGHYHITQACNEMEKMGNLAVRTGDLGNNFARTGFMHADRAMSQKGAAMDAMLTSGNLGMRTLEHGLSVRRLAAQKLQQTIDNAGQGLNFGQEQIRQGYNWANMGSTKLTNAMNNALNSFNAGVGLVNVGLGYQGTIQNQFSQSMVAGQTAWPQLMNQFNHGQRYMELYNANNRNCFDAHKELLNCGKDLLYNAYCKSQNVMANSLAAATATGAGLLDMSGAAVEGAFNALGDSLQSLITFNAPMPEIPSTIQGGGPPKKTVAGAQTTQVDIYSQGGPSIGVYGQSASPPQLPNYGGTPGSGAGGWWPSGV